MASRNDAALAAERARRYRERNHEACLERSRQWRKNNREKSREYYKKWAEANPETVREKGRRYHEANRERKNEMGRKWREANPERVKESSRKWREANIERHRARNSKRRALKAGATVELVERKVVFERDSYVCQICGEPTDGKWPAPSSPSVDHIVPLSKGGEHSYANTQCAHLGCNSRKNNRV